MDAFLAIASKRDRRDYADRPLPEDVQLRILDAGRLAGSAQNRQPWAFVVVESPERKAAFAEVVYAAHNVLTAAFVVAIVVPEGGFSLLDAGRAAQNMLLAAWNDGVVSCPNGISDREAAHEILGLDPDLRIAIALSFGYPTRPADPDAHPAAEWSARANRKALGELVTRV
jgi:nitroreductase